MGGLGGPCCPVADLADERHECVAAVLRSLIEALLAVTDARTQTCRKAVILKAYGTVRGGAAKHIQAALPNLGTMVEKYALSAPM